VREKRATKTCGVTRGETPSVGWVVVDPSMTVGPTLERIPHMELKNGTIWEYEIVDRLDTTLEALWSSQRHQWGLGPVTTNSSSAFTVAGTEQTTRPTRLLASPIGNLSPEQHFLTVSSRQPKLQREAPH